MSKLRPRYLGLLYAVVAILLVIAAEVFNRINILKPIVDPLFFICLFGGLYLAYRAVKIITRWHWAMATGLLIALIISIPFIRDVFKRNHIVFEIVPPIVAFIETHTLIYTQDASEPEALTKEARYLFNSAVWAEQQGQLELAIDFYQAALSKAESPHQQARISARLDIILKSYLQANMVATEALPSQLRIFVVEQ